MSFEVRVPSSSANLGPGFDSLAIALSIHLTVHVDLDDGEAPPNALTDLLGGEDLISAGIQQVARHAGRRLPPYRIVSETDIPVARGLGSSAAAIVAGLQIGALLAGVGELGASDLIALGGEMEGHADNVSAAVLGGVTAAIETDSGHVAVRLAREIPWEPLLFVPAAAAFTKDARGVLPPSIPFRDASANIGRTAMLVQALHTGDDELMGWALEDRLHQPYRAKLFPHLNPIIARSREAGAVGACLSGAGPTVLMFADRERTSDVVRAVDCLTGSLGVPGELLMPSVDTTGVVVRQADQ